jgi:release factor glutamine methyltransferase
VLASAVADAARRLETAGIDGDTSRRDAALLARWVLGWDTAAWLARTREAPPPGFAPRFNALIARRAAREPIAYLTGLREFYGRTFRVNRHVLVPRPETELVVDEALRFLAPRTTPRVVDVGTGSGCLAVTIALECQGAHVVATDSSEAALAIARENATLHGVAERIDWRHADLLGDLTGPFDLIVANLPYVPEGDRESLPPEVSRYEPAAALFGGPDGLDVIRRLLPAAAARLSPGGRVVFEIGAGQAGAVPALIAGVPGLTLVEVRKDLQAIPRVVVAEAERPARARA